MSPKNVMGFSKLIPGMAIHWSGKRGMDWRKLIPQLVKLKQKWPLPDVLILHLGDSDITTTTNTEQLLKTIREELTSIRDIFPQCLIVWSSSLTKKHWKQGLAPGAQVDSAAERVHDMINHTAQAVVTELGGTLITHDNIGPEHYHRTHHFLMTGGIFRFYQNIQTFLVTLQSKVYSVPPKTKATSQGPKVSDSMAGPAQLHSPLTHPGQPLGPQSASTAPDASSWPPSASSSGATRPADRGALPWHPKGAPLDGTPEDSTPSPDTISPPQQPQKGVDSSVSSFVQ